MQIYMQREKNDSSYNYNTSCDAVVKILTLYTFLKVLDWCPNFDWCYKINTQWFVFCICPCTDSVLREMLKSSHKVEVELDKNNFLLFHV